MYALWGEPLAQTAEQIAAVRAESAKYDRSPRFSVSFRPILGPTEELAWERAQRILATVKDRVLVGTPETVAQALLDYVGIGVTTILIRGYDPYDDAVDYGRNLLPLVRAEVERRDRQTSQRI